MTPEEVQDLFLKFATPLAFYVRLGGRKEAMESVARTLWVAMLGGPSVEDQVWRELKNSPHIESGLIESIQTCYREEMKPQLSEENLTALRLRYGIKIDE